MNGTIVMYLISGFVMSLIIYNIVMTVYILRKKNDDAITKQFVKNAVSKISKDPENYLNNYMWLYTTFRKEHKFNSGLDLVVLDFITVDNERENIRLDLSKKEKNFIISGKFDKSILLDILRKVGEINPDSKQYGEGYINRLIDSIEKDLIDSYATYVIALTDNDILTKFTKLTSSDKEKLLKDMENTIKSSNELVDDVWDNLRSSPPYRCTTTTHN